MLFKFIDEVIVFDILYVFAYGLLAIYFYSNEYNIRYNFFLAQTRAEIQQSYRDLIVNLPLPLVLFNQTNDPVLYNRAIKDIVSKGETGSRASSVSAFSGGDQAVEFKEVFLS